MAARPDGPYDAKNGRDIGPRGFVSGRQADLPPLAAQRYQNVAAQYDLWTAAGQTYRDRSVDRLSPARGSVVLDVGCGTGLNFGRLEHWIGPRGRVIGIDVSSEMLASALERVRRHGWQNVTLIEAAAHDAAVPVLADAALLSAVHDILRSPAALANIVSHIRPGGRVAAAGAKWAPWWRPTSPVINGWVWLANRAYVTTFEGFDAPWSHLSRLLPDLAVEEVLLGGGFIAIGTRPT